jgi:hypothetical protein
MARGLPGVETPAERSRDHRYAIGAGSDGCLRSKALGFTAQSERGEMSEANRSGKVYRLRNESFDFGSPFDTSGRTDCPLELRYRSTSTSQNLSYENEVIDP